eukprot:TRINITY_DN642_c0_g2_i2.p1 TRINITY_DN642_c0_g2~~TRINITY_DN642_c0_g2_i2.p1  ORF type:complete len:307 (-),score=84.75 TRINITY_DN642_c0_g2_i2:101-1021(-)
MAKRDRTPDFERIKQDHTIKRPKKPATFAVDTNKEVHNKLLGGEDIELQEHVIHFTPDWVGQVSDIQAELKSIHDKLGVLQKLHKEHLMPGFHDRDDDERSVEIQTAEITKIFHRTHAYIKKLGMGEHLSAENEKMRSNIKCELARELQDLSTSFRNSQKNYLSALRVRQQKMGQYDILDKVQQNVDGGFTQDQLTSLIGMEDRISDRERDVISIARSINELADVFSDLNLLVIDQGTILDRIDYNIEQTSVHVDAAVIELDKANTQSKKSRTTMCILLLVILIVLALVVIILKAIVSAGRSPPPP